MILEILFPILFGLVCQCSECVCEEEPPPPSAGLPPQSEWKFKDCNLWKPEGDNPPRTLRVLIRGDWEEPEFAEVKRKDGSWERMEYKGLSNYCGPDALDRYTYKGDHPGGPDYAGKQKDGGVRLRYPEGFVKIDIPGPPKDRHE